MATEGNIATRRYMHYGAGFRDGGFQEKVRFLRALLPLSTLDDVVIRRYLTRQPYPDTERQFLSLELAPTFLCILASN